MGGSGFNAEDRWKVRYVMPRSDRGNSDVERSIPFSSTIERRKKNRTTFIERRKKNCRGSRRRFNSFDVYRVRRLCIFLFFFFFSLTIKKINSR